MAIFNPDVPNPNSSTPKWGGDSKPLSDVKADTSTATAISGFGDAFKTTVEGVDQIFKSVIDDDVWNKVNSEREQYTNDLEAANAAANPKFKSARSTEQNVPSDLDKSINYLDSIKNGMEQGKVNDTYYKSRLTAIVKDLRSTYPGYREYIDKKVSSITGFDPANSLVSDLLADINTLASANNKNDITKQLTTSMLTTLKDIAKDGGPAGEQAARLSVMVMNGYPIDQAMLQLPKLQKDKADLALQKQNLELIKTNDEQASINGKNYFNSWLNRKVTNMVDTVQTSTGTYTMPQIQEAIRNWRTGKGPAPDAEVITAMGNLVDQQMADIRVEAHREARSVKFAGGKNLYDVITPQGVDDMVKGQLGYLQAIRDDIRNDRLPMALAAAQAIKDNQTTQGQKAMNSPLIRPFIDQRAGLEAAFGEKSPFLLKIAETSVMSEHLGPLRTWLLATTQEAAMNKVKPNPYGPITLADTIKQAREANIPVATTTDEALKNVRHIVDPQTPDDAKRGFVQYFYDTKNLGVLNNFNKDSVDEYGRVKPGKASVFNSLYSKNVIDEAHRVTRSDPELWGMVRNWGLQTFNELVGSDLKTLSGVQLPVGAFISYNDDNHNFVLRYKGKDITEAQPGANRMLTVTDAQGNTQTFSSEALETTKRAINRINIQLKNMSNLAEKENTNVDAYLMNAMVNSGYRPNLNNTTGFSDQMISSIKTLSMKKQLLDQLRDR